MITMLKFYDVGSFVYYSDKDAAAEIMFAKKLNNGNMYFIRFTYLEMIDYDIQYDEATYEERENYERVFEFKDGTNRVLFDNKEEYEKHRRERINQVKEYELRGDSWIRQLYELYCENYQDEIRRTALKEIIKQKLNVDLDNETNDW